MLHCLMRRRRIRLDRDASGQSCVVIQSMATCHADWNVVQSGLFFRGQRGPGRICWACWGRNRGLLPRWVPPKGPRVVSFVSEIASLTVITAAKDEDRRSMLCYIPAPRCLSLHLERVLSTDALKAMIDRRSARRRPGRGFLSCRSSSIWVGVAAWHG
jgi:hypothetical protein